MGWTNLVWVLLYFTVGWIITEAYELDNGIWGLLIFLGWPVLVVSFCVILLLLFAFGLVFVVDEMCYGIFHRKDKT